MLFAVQGNSYGKKLPKLHFCEAYPHITDFQFPWRKIGTEAYFPSIFNLV